jgi:hypothetical protein
MTGTTAVRNKNSFDFSERAVVYRGRKADRQMDVTQVLKEQHEEIKRACGRRRRGRAS